MGDGVLLEKLHEPLIMLACLGVAALIIGIILKRVDAKKHLGLEEPNIK